MKLKLIRNPTNDTCTIGTLFVEAAFECFTLEDVVREHPGVQLDLWKVPGKTAIPRGTYDVIIDMSARFKRELPRLLNVPGFSGVRIHPGNTAADTEGCILLGLSQAPNWIGQSRLAFDRLFTKLERAYERKELITIEVQ